MGHKQPDNQPEGPANDTSGRVSLQLLQNIMDHIGDGVVAVDTNWRYVYVNQKAAELLQRENPEDLLGKNMWEEYPETVGNILYQAYHEALETQKTIQLDAFHPPLERWYENRIYPASDGLTIIFSDITERKNAAIKLSDRNERLEVAVKAANVGLWDWDLETNQVYYSPEWKRQIGYEDHEISNDFDEWQTRVHPDDLQQATEITQGFIADPYPNYRNEFRFRHKDGSYRWIMVQADMIYDDHGKPVRMIGSHIDITERKHAEIALAENEERYRLLIDRSPYAIGVHQDGQIVFTNQAALNLLGATDASQLIGKPISEIVHPETWEAARDRIGRMLNGEQGLYPTEDRYVRLDGSEIAVEVTATPFIFGGKPAVQVIALDIGARKQAEAALKTSEERFRVSTEMAEVAVWEYDLVADEMSRSDNHDKLYGLEKQEKWVIGTFLNATHPDDRERSNQIIQECIKPGGPDRYNFDFRVIWPDERIHWLAVRAEVAVRDETGTATLVRGVLIDVTRRKEIEKALRLADERFSSAFHVSPAGMTITRIADGKFIDANEAFCNMFEYTREEVIGRNSVDLKIWTSEERAKLVRQQAETGGLHNFEVVALSKSGKPVDVLFSSREIQVQGEPGLVTILIDITKRKHMEHTLRESEQRFRLLIQEAPEGIFVQTNHRFAYINPAACRLFDVERAEALLGTPVMERFHPDYHEQILKRIHSLNNRRQAVPPVEEVFLKMDGSPFTAEVSAVPIIFEGNSGAMVFFHDVTERKEAERAIQRFIQRLSILHEIDMGILAATSSQEIIEVVLEKIRQIIPCESASVALYDHDSAEISIIATTGSEAFIPVGMPFDFKDSPFYSILQSAEPLYIPDLRQRGNLHNVGNTLVSHGVRSTVMGVLIVRNRPIGFLGLLSKDVDAFTAEHIEIVQEVANQLAIALNQAQLYEQIEQQNRELEQRVIERTADLQRSEARYRAAVQDQTDMVCRYLEDGTLTFVNQAYCQHFNRTEEQLLGTNRFEMLNKEARNLLWENIASLNQDHSLVAVELSELSPDGLTQWIHWNEHILFDIDGEFLEYQGVGRDITGRKLVEENLEQMLNHAMKLSELRSRYMSMAAHDLRNPLTIILNTVNLIERYMNTMSDDQKVSEFTRVRDAIKIIVEMLDGILAIGKVESGAIKFNPRPLNIKDFCNRMVMEAQQAVTTKRQIDFKITGDTDIVFMDSQLLRHILSNLLSNAIKYSHDDSAVAFTVTPNAEHIVFTIRDQGIGIPEAEQPRLFEAFHHASNARSISGTGLGLAIVKQSVDLHGGTIDFESQENAGTTFTVTLPIHSQVAD